MIRSTKIIFCDEEHGTGDVTFPAICDLDDADFISTPSMAALRRNAKKAGWRRTKKADYCPDCADLMKTRNDK